jgi:hypothetical protein
MNGLVKFRLCRLSDKELVDKVDMMVDKMYEDGKIPVRHIPALPHLDFDLLVGELITRFIENLGVTNRYVLDAGDLLIAWERFKKANWWESDAIDVEKLLMDRFLSIYKANSKHLEGSK